MNTSTAFPLFSQFVTRCVRKYSRLRDQSTLDDITQEVWQATLTLTLPHDPDQCRRLLATIARRKCVDVTRSACGRSAGSLARKVSSSPAAFDSVATIDQAPTCGESWSSLYPEQLRYLVEHLGNGGSARELYAIHGEYRVRQDFIAIREFLNSRQNVSAINA